MKKVKFFTRGLTFHMAVVIVFWFLIFNTITSIIGYISFTDAFTEFYNKTAFRTARTTVQLIDGGDIDDYLDYAVTADWGSEEYADSQYENIRSRMDNICQNQEATYIYTIKVDESDYGRYQFVFTTANAAQGKTPTDISGEYIETTNEEYRQKYENLYTGRSTEETVLRTKNLKPGATPHVTSLIPVYDQATSAVKAILAAEYPMSELVSMRGIYLRDTLLSTIGLIIISVLCVMCFLRHQFVTPLNHILAEVKRFAKETSLSEKGDLECVCAIRELEELTSTIVHLEHDTVGYMENLTRVTAEQERLDTELALAKRIQANVLPNLFPPFPDRREFDIFASMTPAKEVGGDFYDFFLLDEDHLGLVMADVSGKGVPAALFMMATKNLIKTYAMNGGTPSQILQTVNREICKHNTDDMFVTVWFGILTLSTGKVIASNAGHEYPAIKRRGGMFELFKDKHGFVIGGIDTAKYRDYEFDLLPGDSLFVYTDGVPEATDSDKKMFTTDGMLEALNAAADDSPQTILANVNRGIDTFVGDAEQFDDITMLSIRVNCLQSKCSITTYPELESVSLVNDFLSHQITQWEIPHKPVNKMQIAVDEIYSNIMRYSEADTATVSCGKDDKVITLTFADNGVAFDPTQVKEPDTTLSAEEREIGGLGIHMVRKSASSMAYERRDDQNILTLTFNLS